MINSLHTAGPWKSEDARTPFGRPAIAKEIVAGFRHIADVRLYEDADAANAQLIAAAPDLLEALELLTEKSQLPDAQPFGYMDALDKARAAIVKAKGSL